MNTIGVSADKGDVSNNTGEYDSAHLSNSVSERYWVWQSAFQRLRRQGWKSNEILAACDWFARSELSAQSRDLMADWYSAGTSSAAQWDVSEQRWRAMARDVQEEGDIVLALTAVASHYGMQHGDLANTAAAMRA